MMLDVQDIQWLKCNDYTDKDILQIIKAIGYTSYSLEGQRLVKPEFAIKILGKEQWLSGLCRSAFHYTSVREGKHGVKIHFDSSKLFKEA